MTIEAERTESRFFGLKKSITRRVLEYREWIQQINPSMEIQSRQDRVILSAVPVRRGRIIEGEFVFAKPISEDDLVVFTEDLHGREKNHVTYSAEGINRENIVGSNGVRIIWRETQPGDYPPLEPGQEMHPIQQSLRLV